MAVEDTDNYGLTGAQVKELVEQTKKRAVSVGEDGSSHVEEADQIYTKTLQLQEAGFIFRTTAGNLSVGTGSADLLAIKGHTVQEGHQEEVRDFSYEFADPNTTAEVNWTKLISYIENIGVFVEQGEQGTIAFSYRLYGSSYVWALSTSWGTSGGVPPTSLGLDWGITVTGDVTEGDSINIQVAVLKIGTLTTAKPTSYVATGYNQYDATAGYAHVIGGNQYRIAGTYTSIGIADEPGGTTTTLEVTNGKFTPETDGYVYVSGASGDILIALVWTGTRDNDPYEAFSKTTITIPTIDKESNSLPTATYGMPSVGDVADELNFADKLYIQRIGHYAYSAENLETVEALGVDYWYDEEDIFYVLETPIEYKLADSVRGEYTANDFGTEEFVGTSVSVDAMLTYGNNLVDKLRNLLDIQSIGDKLELNGGELNVAQSALGDIKIVDSSWPNNLDNTWLVMSSLPSGGYLIERSNCIPTGLGSNDLKNGDLVFVSPLDANGYVTVSVQTPRMRSEEGVVRVYYVKPGRYPASYTSQAIGQSDIVDNLTVGGSKKVLSAKQGQVLAPKSASGAPTTTTQPYGNMVGKLYIDTDTQNVYIYVGKNGNDYIWKQINVS